MHEKILKINEVTALTTLSRTTIYRGVAAGNFPAPVQLSPRRVGWPQHSIEQYLQRGRDGGAQ